MKKFLEKKCILAVSGGADSMCMLNMALSIAENKKNIIVVHINHNLRQNEAKRDALFVEQFCKQNDIECVIESVDVKALVEKEHISIEEAGRQLRYKIFYYYKEYYRASYIMLAHNKNDNVETFIHNLIRGSGVLGLLGMKIEENDIVRPLITMSREEIERYNRVNKVEHIVDSTNYELNYTRNKIRNILIPYFSEINIRCTDHISSTMELLREQHSLIEKIVEREKHRIKFNKESCEILLDDIENDYLKSEIIREAIKNLFGLKNIRKIHIDDMVKLSKVNTNSTINLPQDWMAKRIFGGISIRKADYKFEISLQKAIEEKYFQNKIALITDNENALCYDKLKEAVIRNRYDGDYIYTTKKIKLKDFLIKKKIHPLKRDELIVLALGQRIVWVENLYVDKTFKAKNEKGVKIELL